MKYNIIIDIEFTGLDNEHVKDNEIIQLKAHCVETGKDIVKNFNTKKHLTAYSFLCHRVNGYDKAPYFDAIWYLGIIGHLTTNEGHEFKNEQKDITFWGFSPKMDILMLKKYGIEIGISDIKEVFQKSKYAYRLATEGNNLECTYYIVTGKVPNISSHDGIDELNIIKELYHIAQITETEPYMTIVPFGFCAGMPIEQYFSEYRRNADGYRYNNTDAFAAALDKIAIQESEWYDDDFDDFDDDEDE